LFEIYGIEEETPNDPQVHPFEQCVIARAKEQRAMANLATNYDANSNSVSEAEAEPESTHKDQDPGYNILTSTTAKVPTEMENEVLKRRDSFPVWRK
jgi:hypothetical protein